MSISETILNHLRGLAACPSISATTLGLTGLVPTSRPPRSYIFIPRKHPDDRCASSTLPLGTLQDNGRFPRTTFGVFGFGTAAGHYGAGAGDMNFATAALAAGRAMLITLSTASNTSGTYATRDDDYGRGGRMAARLVIGTVAPAGFAPCWARDQQSPGRGFQDRQRGSGDESIQTVLPCWHGGAWRAVSCA